MTVESALLKQILAEGDFDSWNRLKQHYLPEGEYQKLWKVVDKHVHKFHALPTFDALKAELENFADSINGDSTPVVDGNAAKNALELAITIDQMIREDLH